LGCVFLNGFAFEDEPFKGPIFNGTVFKARTSLQREAGLSRKKKVMGKAFKEGQSLKDRQVSKE